MHCHPGPIPWHRCRGMCACCLVLKSRYVATLLEKHSLALACLACLPLSLNHSCSAVCVTLEPSPVLFGCRIEACILARDRPTCTTVHACYAHLSRFCMHLFTQVWLMVLDDAQLAKLNATEGGHAVCRLDHAVLHVSRWVGVVTLQVTRM